MLAGVIRALFAKRAAAAAAPAAPLAAMRDAERSVRKLIEARDDAGITDRLAKAALPADVRDSMFKIAKALPGDDREVIFAALDALAEVQKAADSVLFKELGSGLSGGEGAGDALASIESAAAAQAQSLRKSDGKPLTAQQAVARAIEADPSLYRTYKAERRARFGWPT